MALINKPICALLALLVWPLACGQADSGHQSGRGGVANIGSGGKNAGGSASPGGDGGLSGLGGGASDGGALAGGTPSLSAAGSGGAAHSGGGPSVAAGGTSSTGGVVGQPMGGAETNGDPPLCTRLGTDAAILSERVAWSYANSVYRDCRVSGFYNSISIQQRIAAVNALNVFSIELWGCVDSAPSDFALSLGTRSVSRSDAELLVSLYLDAVSAQLQPSASEEAKLTSDLAALAERSITIHIRPDAFLHSECGSGAGGAGGEGGWAGGSGAPPFDTGSERGGTGGSR